MPGLTLYARTGDLPTGLALAVAVVLVVQGRRRRSKP